ncbi:MAG: hypothetical protein SFW62_01630 [Alphaproteobacteria bacterium]|nr:hypothetical protein [Alphaproteobacteria bacterium]
MQLHPNARLILARFREAGRMLRDDFKMRKASTRELEMTARIVGACRSGNDAAALALEAKVQWEIVSFIPREIVKAISIIAGNRRHGLGSI